MTTGCPALSAVRACYARYSLTTLSAASVGSMFSALSSCSKVSCLLSSRVIAVRKHSSAVSFRTRDCSSLVLRVAFALLCSDSVFIFRCDLFVVRSFAVMRCACIRCHRMCVHSLRFWQGTHCYGSILTRFESSMLVHFDSDTLISMVTGTVVVLGDIGRSPRMQYHCLSLAAEGVDVTRFRSE